MADDGYGHGNRCYETLEFRISFLPTDSLTFHELEDRVEKSRSAAHYIYTEILAKVRHGMTVTSWELLGGVGMCQEPPSLDGEMEEA